ncbi:MAG: Gx transporter family protein [Clostridiaceae bacterium]|nr:Gx transporter family protein [Clostridiaceae bacterium]
MKTNKVTRIGMMIAVAFVLSYLESLLPLQIGIPGVKLGLSNIVVVLCLYSCSAAETFGIALVRILLCGLTFGSLYTMLYSFAGGVLSFAVMLFLKKWNGFSVYGVSIAGGVCHNIGQIVVAILVLQTELLIYYFPFLLLSGCIAGVAVGFVAGMLVKRLRGIF